ncbi:MAG: ORF6C domain-containing protein [Ardenticatenaceae bacterium]|nr:ORF6C domain-containing protein [Ardenticatenaceae bacterium]
MSKALVPVEQKTVVFYDDELTAVRSDDGQIYVGITEMCKSLGIDAQAQRRRMERHAVLADGYKGVANLATPGGVQSGYVLRVDLVPLWLSGIRTSAVSEEIRPKLERFQREAAAILWEAFQEGRLTADSNFDELLKTADEGLVQAYQMAQAIVQLARNQILLDSRMTQAEQRLDMLEATLGNPEKQVTPDQASQISQAVKAVALALGKKTNHNEFGACYGELYRRYGITSYKALPAHKFEDALQFLTEWHQDITTNTPF